MPIKIIIYDDNLNRRESLKLLVDNEEDMQCCGTFNDCINILTDVVATVPDVILMDIDMPRMSGIEGVKLLRQANSEVSVIMQTVFDDTEKIFASIEAGANGYILKSASNSKILEGIRDVLSGGAPMTASIAKKVLERFQTTSAPKQEAFPITETERIILSQLTSGMSYKMIAEKQGVSFHTVNMHIKNIYKKLHVHSATEAIAKAIKNNLD